MKARGWGVAAAVAVAGLAGVTPAAAQVDSTAIRVRERLERLARPPAPDTVSAFGEDTVVIAGRRGAPGPGAVPAEDSVVAQLLELAEYASTRYEGRAASFDAAERVLVLTGDTTSQAVVRREGMELTADSVIRYDEVAGRIRAEGRPVFRPSEGDPVESRVIVYDLNRERGSALDARTRYSSGANWIVTGDLPAVSADAVFASHARFTSCELDEPHYHFETDEIQIVSGNILVARPVRLYFADVPVAWLPFIAQSLARGRSSGILTPRFGVNDIVRTSGGYNRRISNVGFYWAINDYMDGTLALDWFSDNFTSLTGSYRYRWVRQFLDGSVDFRQYWRAEGGTETSFDTRHRWEPDERTKLNLSARWASSTDFVRRNSFDPREVTQSITSSGGATRRYDWGGLSLSATRNEYLSDDRVEMTLPDASLNLTPLTLFRAPSSTASWYNNLTWSGSTNFRRTIRDLAAVPPDSLTVSDFDTGTLSSSVTSSFDLGNLSLNQNVSFRRGSVFQVPDTFPGFFVPAAGYSPRGTPLGTMASQTAPVELLDFDEDRVEWSTRLSYQQTLIGSTTITPNLRLSGEALRSDTVPVAQGFVGAPMRTSFGATLKTDLYGLFGGFGPFSALRHKVSPSFDYAWSPGSTPDALQERVFGRRVLQPRNEVSVRVSQTLEAKRRPREEATEEGGEEDRPGGPGAAGVPGAEPMADTASAAPAEEEGPRRRQQQEIVTLLALTTSVVEYDFVEADSAGDFLLGFTTTQLRNQISSDFLRGLTVNFTHDLFRDTLIGEGAGGEPPVVQREFDLRLTQLNLGFSLNNRSALLRGFGLFGDDAEPGEPGEPDLPDEEEPFSDARPALDGTTVIPGLVEDDSGPMDRAFDGQGGGEDVGQWNANFSYALSRPRGGLREPSQMLQVSFDLKPTAQWDLGWRTSYDLERGAFNDHMIRLTRDLHRWQAHFDFTSTATGNWAFSFEVSLRDNRDLKLDYRQRNVEGLDQRRTGPR